MSGSFVVNLSYNCACKVEGGSPSVVFWVCIHFVLYQILQKFWVRAAHGQVESILKTFGFVILAHQLLWVLLCLFYSL